MRTICFYFQVHQPFRFRRYRFFDIGNEHYYYDDYSNESIFRKVAENCYLPANKILLELIRKYKGEFKVAFSISGIAMDQMELYGPDVLESFRELADTGSVEFLAETNSHSLVALQDEAEFRHQVEVHSEKVRSLFGQSPTTFRNTELIYSDEIGSRVYRMGYKTMLTEGAKHILGWKSPNYLYCNASEPKLKVLLKNFKLSDDIAFRFSDQGWDEYPLTAEKYAAWLNDIDKQEETVNLFMDYETFGEHQWKETGIFDFLKALPEAVFRGTDMAFATPSEVAEKLQPVSAIQVPYPISWADEERDLTAWLGNELQEEAFNNLYELLGKVRQIKDPVLLKDWNYLQVSDHFYYMCTKFFSDGAVHSYFNPYESPYDAFINYMNILSDFTLRVNAAVPRTSTDKEIANLSGILDKKEQQIEKYEKELYELNKQLLAMQSGNGSKASAPSAVKKSTKPPTGTKAKKSVKSATGTKAKKSVKSATGTKAKKSAKPASKSAGRKTSAKPASKTSAKPASKTSAKPGNKGGKA